MNLGIYKPEIRERRSSILTGEGEQMIPHDDEGLNRIAVIKAFLDDDDLQEMTVCSTNIGFVRTFRKFYITADDSPPQ